MMGGFIDMILGWFFIFSGLVKWAKVPNEEIIGSSCALGLFLLFKVLMV